MKNVLKFMGLYLIAGAACKAGEQLWDDVLKGKVTILINNVKKKFQKTEA